MNKEEKYIARLKIKNKFYESDKQSFEDVFTKIMQNSNGDFKQVKPQGRFGDGKCDGFNAKTGEYYQVYAPEELTGKEDKANTKMESSVTGLIDFWTKNNFEVNKFYFVVKDDYRNVYASFYTTAKALSTKFKIKCEILLCKDIEDVFLKLDDEKIIDVIGLIPDPLNIDNVEFGVMGEVINYMLKSKSSKTKYEIPTNPNFDKKIEFNSLSRAVSNFLNAGQRQNFVIKEYFELNSNFIKEDLRQVFNEIYKKGIDEIPNSTIKNDEIFQYIVEKSSPLDNFAVHNAVYVLMAYYFEYCDIFETPTV